MKNTYIYQTRNIQYVNVLKKFSIGSDLRLVLAKFVINTRKERRKMINGTPNFKPTHDTYRTTIRCKLKENFNINEDEINTDDLKE